MIYNTNVWEILIAAVGSFVIGWLWFGPLFGKVWMRLSHITHADQEEAKRKGMAKQLTISIISSIITAFVLLSILGSMIAPSVVGASIVAFWVWLGFSVPTFLNGVLWEDKSWKLFWISSTHILATLVFTGLVYSFWK